MATIHSATLSSISPSCRSVLIGSILGDASLAMTRNGKLSHFREEHADKQRDYLHWKAAMMTDLSAHVTPGGLLSINACQLLTDLRCGFYINSGVKDAIPVSVVAPLVDDLLLLVWYLDDGGVTGQRKTLPRISSALPRVDIDDFLSAVNDTLGLHLRASTYQDSRPNRSPLHSIYIPTEDQRELFGRWVDLSGAIGLPENMMYKLYPVVNKNEWFPPLSEEEVAVVYAHAETLCAAEIAKLLPGRHRNTISDYAKRHGIAIKDGSHIPWTEEQEAVVKELYPDANNQLADIAIKVGRTAFSVKGKAVALRLSRG